MIWGSVLCETCFNAFTQYMMNPTHVTPPTHTTSTSIKAGESDNKDILWNKLAKKEYDSCRNYWDQNLEQPDWAFHFACKTGHLKMAKVLVQKSAELNINLNAKNHLGKAAFYHACYYGHLNIAEMLQAFQDIPGIIKNVCK